MRPYDILALALVLLALAAFGVGLASLARTDDARAVYLFFVGFVLIHAGTQIAKSGVIDTSAAKRGAK